MENKTILVIDDEEVYTTLLPSYIDAIFPNRFRILTSNHPEEALTILKREKIDLLITDLLMPRIDGEYLIKTLKKDSPEIPIILVTGADEIPHSLQDEKVGCAFILKKPFSKSEISEALISALHPPKG